MSEEVPLKGNDSEELVIGQSSKASLTIKTIGATVKKYWFKKNEKKPEKNKKNGFRNIMSTRNKLILSVYKEELAIKIKNYINIERFLPFILIFITLFRFIYLNALLITYLHSIYIESSHSSSCLCTLIIVYLVFLFRFTIDSLDTAIIPIFTLLSVYYKFVSLKSHHVIFMTFWPFFALILSYILYGILFCFCLFAIPWILCDDEWIKESPNLFWKWFISFKYILFIFNGKWNIKCLFHYQYWSSFPIIYCNSIIMSYFPYLFMIGLVFGFLLLRHLLLNLKSIFCTFMYKTWRNFKQFYIILIPIISLRFIYLLSMWIVFFFVSDQSLYHSSPSVACDVIVCTLFFVMIFHSIFDAMFCPLIGIECFIYFECIHRIFTPFLTQCLSTICGKCIVFEEDNTLNNDYGMILSDTNNDLKNIKNKNKNKNEIKISLNSIQKCLGKNRLILLVSICFPLLKLILFYLVFGVVFVFLSIGIIWANCSDSNIQKTPCIIWQWFIAPLYLFQLNNEWSIDFIINPHKWSSIESIFLNYLIICFVPYLVMIGCIILCKIVMKLYEILIILTERFSAICGAEFTLFFIVFVFYRWLYLVFMFYELIFNNDDDNMYKTDDMWCRVSLICVFCVIVFRSIFDSFLCIEFFIFVFDSDLWCLFIIGLFWPFIKLVISCVLFVIFCVFFLFGFSFVHCNDITMYLMLFWQWFIAPQSALHNGTIATWQFKYLFNRKYWRSIEILYINYTLTAFAPMIFVIFCVFLYFLFNYKHIQHNVIFILLRKRFSLIFTILLSYNHLLSFIIYCFHYKLSILMLVSLQIISYLLFYSFHSYFRLSFVYYKSIAKYYFLIAIDWKQTFLCFASLIYDYGEHSVLWNSSWNKRNYKIKKKAIHIRIYYCYFRCIHTIIKLIFLCVSIVLYCVEVLFKLIIFMIYAQFRLIHYFLVIYLMHFAKFAQIECFLRHYAKYCVGIKIHDDDDHQLQIINMHCLFNLSIIIDAVFQSLFVLIIVSVETVMHWQNMHSLLNIQTIWSILASLLMIINALSNIIPQFKNKGNLKETLSNQMFGRTKKHNIQYGLIASDTDAACVILPHVVHY